MSSWSWDPTRQKYYYIERTTGDYVYTDNERISSQPNSTSRTSNASLGHSGGSTGSSGYSTDLTSQSSIQQQTSVPAGQEPSNVVDNIWDYYQDIGYLGAGGQATVREVQSIQDGRSYAMKIYTFRNQQKFQAKRPTVMGEINIMERLDASSDIIRLVRWYEDPARFTYYIVMEKADLGTLWNVLERQFDSPETNIVTSGLVRDVFVRMSRGLADIHRIDTRHKDIKPSNILVCSSDNANDSWVLKYADFGMAIDFSGSGNSLTTGAGFSGTWAYAAPECWSDRVLTGRTRKSDIWSLGCVFFEVLAGRSTALTGDKYWMNFTVYDIIRGYDNGRARSYYGFHQHVMEVLNTMVGNDNLWELHVYVPIVRQMLQLDPQYRPDASSILG
ncbi:kinase-like protein [Lophiostoma macrostomum CBS 122681]|uniref:Kinase-like protein n=1 Tax=Lophiostoma macrostomum CBS 122681 TaxID=1314788 RepID=A0A6A6SJ48_9PLEO|nr:kinase-like protein [Lophiostoma macrostomum CBS 122681]